MNEWASKLISVLNNNNSNNNNSPPVLDFNKYMSEVRNENIENMTIQKEFDEELETRPTFEQLPEDIIIEETSRNICVLKSLENIFQDRLHAYHQFYQALAKSKQSFEIFETCTGTLRQSLDSLFLFVEQEIQQAKRESSQIDLRRHLSEVKVDAQKRLNDYQREISAADSDVFKAEKKLQKSKDQLEKHLDFRSRIDNIMDGDFISKRSVNNSSSNNINSSTPNSSTRSLNNSIIDSNKSNNNAINNISYKENEEMTSKYEKDIKDDIRILSRALAKRDEVRTASRKAFQTLDKDCKTAVGQTLKRLIKVERENNFIRNAVLEKFEATLEKFDVEFDVNDFISMYKDPEHALVLQAQALNILNDVNREQEKKIFESQLNQSNNCQTTNRTSNSNNNGNINDLKSPTSANASSRSTSTTAWSDVSYASSEGNSAVATASSGVNHSTTNNNSGLSNSNSVASEDSQISSTSFLQNVFGSASSLFNPNGNSSQSNYPSTQRDKDRDRHRDKQDVDVKHHHKDGHKEKSRDNHPSTTPLSSKFSKLNIFQSRDKSKEKVDNRDHADSFSSPPPTHPLHSVDIGMNADVDSDKASEKSADKSSDVQGITLQIEYYITSIFYSKRGFQQIIPQTNSTHSELFPSPTKDSFASSEFGNVAAVDVLNHCLQTASMTPLDTRNRSVSNSSTGSNYSYDRSPSPSAFSATNTDSVSKIGSSRVGSPSLQASAGDAANICGTTNSVDIRKASQVSLEEAVAWLVINVNSLQLRTIFITVLNKFRSKKVDVGEGFLGLAAVLWGILEQCQSSNDVHSAKVIMMLIQTFYRQRNASSPTTLVSTVEHAVDLTQAVVSEEVNISLIKNQNCDESEGNANNKNGYEDNESDKETNLNTVNIDRGDLAKVVKASEEDFLKADNIDDEDDEEDETNLRRGVMHREFLKEILISHPIWKDSFFWEQVLWQCAFEQLQTLPYQVPWYDMDRDKRLEVVIHVHNVIFSQVMAIAHSMMELGCGRIMIREFVYRMCVIHQLNEAQRQQMLTHLLSRC